MRDNMTRRLSGLQRSFGEFTAGQKVVAIVGTAALLLGGFMVFRWAAAPSYAPLFSGLAAADASAVVEQLESTGVPYELGNGGTTILVPRDQVYDTRIALSGEGLPTTSSTGYSLLDDQGLSTSEFKERTDFKRAMEGELNSTIAAIDGVEAAVVHLALPEKDVFADEQQPPTASVLVSTSTGSTLGPDQVQAVVHLVASSIDGLDPDEVTVADSSGTVLSNPGDSTSATSTARAQQTAAVQDEMHGRLQAMLDRVVGPGNSTVQVTAELDFDKSVSETTDYQADPDLPVLSSTTSTERYNGMGDAGGAAAGVVGPDGEMETDATGTDAGSSYTNRAATQDNGVDVVRETRETAPGSIETTHVGVVLDTATTTAVAPADIRDLVTDALGLSAENGDSVRVLSLPFDRSTEESAAAELAAAEDAASAATRNDLMLKAGIAVLVLIALVVAALLSRRRNKKREQATTYVVEQLRQDRAAITAPDPATMAVSAASLALEEADARDDHMQSELVALIERQPDDVAELLRGWLVERN